MTPIEQQRARALLQAIRAEDEGPELAARVRRRQEAILARRRPRGPNKGWLLIDAATLETMVEKLDGPTSTARHLGIVRVTLRKWAARSRIPAWAYARLVELIAAGAPSLRRQNRGRDRHYLSKNAE